MPGNPGVTVVTTLVCFLLCTRGCGRIRRPAFPAPSDFQLGRTQSRTRAKTRGEIAKLCLPGLARGTGTKQSILPLPLYGLLRFARNDVSNRNVVPAKAGTHKHRRYPLHEAVAAISPTTKIGGYGS